MKVCPISFPLIVSYSGEILIEASLKSYLEAADLGANPLEEDRDADLPVGLKVRVSLYRPSFLILKPST